MPATGAPGHPGCRVAVAAAVAQSVPDAIVVTVIIFVILIRFVAFIIRNIINKIIRDEYSTGHQRFILGLYIFLDKW